LVVAIGLSTQCRPELYGNSFLFVPLLLGSVNGNQVIVMKVDAVGANFSQQIDQIGRTFGLTDSRAKWIATGIADRPQAKSNLCSGLVYKKWSFLILSLRWR